MRRLRLVQLILCAPLIAGLINTSAAAQAVDETSRFFGTWRTTFPFNGQTVTMVSVHDTAGYKNFVVTPTGNSPAGTGTFSASKGKYTSSADAPNNAGTYHFLDDNTVICTNAAGQTVTWRRQRTSQQPATGHPAPGTRAAAPPAPTAPATITPAAYDPSLPPRTNAAIAAFNKQDYPTAWNDFMADAQQGNAEAQAGVGSMLFNHLNPPGTGYYAQCEQWLLKSANQGNARGMDYLAQYYYASGVAIAGGINPAANHTPIPPALQQQAESRFALARQWFERSVAKNDGYAMGNLAILLDAGVGGPTDTSRATQLRERLKHLTDPKFVDKATADPARQAMDAAWQAGHYADAIQRAQTAADKGDANAQALLGRAFYEGVGVPLDWKKALFWTNKAVAQNNRDAIFILGLMNELGRGVPLNNERALALFDRAAAMGQRYAEIEAKGMRIQGESNALAARYAAQCHSRGGIVDGFECEVGGFAIDPY